jgi:hypothetical protein
MMSVRESKIFTKIRQFEQSFIPDKESLKVPEIKKILLALDAHDSVFDSSRYSIEVASHLSIKYDAVIDVICMVVTSEARAH